MPTTVEALLSIPEAAVAAGVPLDKLRRRVRENRTRLREAGVLVKIGPLDFARANRLADLAALVTSDTNPATEAAGAC
jgi:hypothetical protein